MYFIYLCWDITHHFKALVQKIKIKDSCSYLAEFSFDIEWFFSDVNFINVNTINSLSYHKSADTIRVSAAPILSDIMPREDNS